MQNNAARKIYEQVNIYSTKLKHCKLLKVQEILVYVLCT